MQNDIFKKVKTQKKSTVVVEQIVHLIREKKLKEGDRLPAERYLSETLGVSRGVLREAIRALEIAGVINAVSGSGNYISLNEDGFSKEYDALKILSAEDNPLDIIIVRKNLEPLAVKLAAKNATENDIKKIEKIVKEMEYNKNQGIIDNRIDGDFHIAIAESSKNQILIDIMKLIVLKMQQQKFWQYTKVKSILSLGHSALYLKEHAMLLEAIKAGDGKTALDIIKNHLNDVEKDYRKYF